jgi:hypothetical protein
MNEDKDTKQCPQQPVNIFYPSVINIEGVINILRFQVFLKIRGKLAGTSGWNPAAKAFGPVGAAHTTLRHPYNTACKYYQHYHKAYKPGIAEIFFVIRHCSAKLTAIRRKNNFLLIDISEIAVDVKTILSKGSGGSRLR